jgi:hypothetical protein
LLYQNNKKVIIEESKARNKTFYRKGGNRNNDFATNDEKASNGNAFPKLKVMIPENSFHDEEPNYKKPIKYNNLRSSGYGPSKPASRMRESDPVPMSKTKGTKLPPLRRDFR